VASCGEIEPLVAPFVDGGAGADERAVVTAHLAACEPCRTLAAHESTARELLQGRRAALAPAAPSRLHARCARLAAAPDRAFTRRWFGVRLVPLAAAAVLVLGVAGGTLYLSADANTVLAAGLALDHVKCFTLFEPSDPADARALASMLQANYGLHVSIPAGSPRADLRLVGARRCFSTDGRVAHIMYRHAGHALSLFIVPDTNHPPARLTTMGQRAVIWSAGRATFVVMAREPEAELEQAARYFRGSIEAPVSSR
jgi:anti-sigma factor RsiW